MTTRSILRSVRLSNYGSRTLQVGRIQSHKVSGSDFNSKSDRETGSRLGVTYRQMSTERGIVKEKQANISGTPRSQGPDEGTF
jgi:hypothetical protein